MDRRLRYRLNREKQAETVDRPKAKVEAKKVAENAGISQAQDWIDRLSAVAAEITNFKISASEREHYDMVNLDFAQQQLLEQ